MMKTETILWAISELLKIMIILSMAAILVNGVKTSKRYIPDAMFLPPAEFNHAVGILFIITLVAMILESLGVPGFEYLSIFKKIEISAMNSVFRNIKAYFKNRKSNSKAKVQPA